MNFSILAVIISQQALPPVPHNVGAITKIYITNLMIVIN